MRDSTELLTNVPELLRLAPSKSTSIVPLLVRKAPELLVSELELRPIEPLLIRWAPELLMSEPKAVLIEPWLVSAPEFAMVPPLRLNSVPKIRLLPVPRVRLAPESIFRVLPVGRWRAFAFPLVLSSTVLVPFRMQAFVEAVGVPLVQLPLRSQKLLPPFCQVVEGALRAPHWAPTLPAPMDSDSTSMSIVGRTREGVKREC